MTTIDDLQANLRAALDEVERQKTRRAEERHAYESRLQQLRVDAEKEEESSTTTSAESEMAKVLLSLGGTLERQNQVLSRAEERAQAQTPQAIIMPNVQNMVRDFQGTETPEKASAWIRELELTKTINGWTDAVAFSIAKAHLKNAALKWYLTRIEAVQNFEQFKTSFKATFTMKRSRSEKLRVMTARSQNGKETIQEYVLDKIWLCDGLGFTADEIRDEVADGLLSRDLSNHILAKNYATTDEMLQDMIKFEKLELHRRERGSGKRTFWPESTGAGKQQQGVSSSGGTSSSSKAETKSLPRTSENRPASSGAVECFRCKKVGHYARDCPVEKRVVTCYACKKEGHIASRCTEKENTDRGNVALVLDGNKSASGEKFVREIGILGTRMKALIDMGASVCTIKAMTALKLGLPMEGRLLVLEGFGDNVVESPGIVCADITLDVLKPKRVAFRVVPDNVQRDEIILGRPFTEALDITYTRKGYDLTFANIDPSLFDDYKRKPMKSYALENVKLEPNAVRFINIRSHVGDCELPMMNIAEHDVSVKTGERIGESILSIEKVPTLEPRKDRIELEEVITDDIVTESQKAQLVEILNEYRDCIAKKPSELGCTSLISMDIEIEEGKQPPQAKPYRLNAKDREDLDQIITEYKDAGLITETSSEYASPAFLVRRPDGRPRMVIDYRRVNKITKPINFPIPNFDDLLDKLSGATVFITLDLAHGYLQVPLAESAQEKSAFISETQTGEFKRAMLGLVNAPKYFAKLMHKVLGQVQRRGIAFTFFDDTCIFAKSWEEVILYLIEILELLKEAGLTLNLKKCKFGMRQVEFLGYILGEGVIRPGERKIQAIAEFPRPRNVHQVRRFHGLASFFRRFVPHFSQLAMPLTDLLKTSQIFEWTVRQEEAFNLIKAKLVARPALRFYNPNALRTELHTDASAVGLAAMLFQADTETDQLQLVYAISRRNSEVEKLYHSTRLELMAIAWALQRLRSFLIGIEFLIVTDCQCLINLNAWKTQNAQIARWISSISEYNFEIKHRKGDLMRHVDALSRAPVGETEPIECERGIFVISTREDEILAFQRTDPSILRMIEILQKPERERSSLEKNAVRDYTMREGLLFKRCIKDNEERELYVVPRAMRKALVIRYHDLKSHFGTEKTVKRISEYYHFAGLKRYVNVHIRNCFECILAKRKSGKPEGELHPIPPGRRPFDIIHMDHLGPFTTTPRKNKYILGIIDNLTKFVYIVAVKDVSARITVNKVREFFDRFGAPGRVISDRGTCFTSKSFKELCELYGVKHTLNSSRHPQANGLVERLNQTMLPALRAAVESEEQNDWDVGLKQLERDINSTVCKATGKTPFKALYGFLPRFEDGNAREVTSHCETYRPPSEIQTEIRKHIIDAQGDYKKRCDAKRYKGVKYTIGDIVFVKRNPNATGTSTKLQPIFGGPMVVVEVLPGDTYRIKKLNETRDRGFESTAHVSQLKIWRGTGASDDEDDSFVESELKSDNEEDNNKCIVVKEADVEPDKHKEKLTNIVSNDLDDNLSENKRSQRVRRPPRKLLDFDCNV